MRQSHSPSDVEYNRTRVNFWIEKHPYSSSSFSSHDMRGSVPTHASTTMHCLSIGTRLTSPADHRPKLVKLWGKSEHLLYSVFKILIKWSKCTQFSFIFIFLILHHNAMRPFHWVQPCYCTWEWTTLSCPISIKVCGKKMKPTFLEFYSGSWRKCWLNTLHSKCYKTWYRFA